MKRNHPPTSSPAPNVQGMAQRLARYCNSPVLDSSDLAQEASIALWVRRAQIAASANPTASAYTLARQTMWYAVRRANAGR